MADRKDHRGNRVPQDAPTTRETPEERGARMGREARERLQANRTSDQEKRTR